MADSASVISSKNSEKSKLSNLINRTTSETLRLNDIEKAVNSPNSFSTNAPRKKTSFQITSVIVGSRASNDGGDDSADDLDESHAEDISEVLDNSRITDLENETPSYSEDTFSKDDVFFNASSSLISAPVIPTSSQYGLAIVATSEHSESALHSSDNCENSDSVGVSGIEVTDSVINLGVVSTKHDSDMRDMHPPAPRTERFKVVKIESTEPFKRGRWVCMDYLDHNIAQKDNTSTKTESGDSTVSVPTESAPVEQSTVVNSTEEQPQAAVPSEVVNTPATNMQPNENNQVSSSQIPISSAPPSAVPTSYPSVSPGQSLQSSMQMGHIINSSAPPPVSQQSQSLSQVHMQQILANSNQHQSLQPQQIQQVIASANVASMPQQQNQIQQPILQQPMQQMHQQSQQFQTQQQQSMPQQQQQSMPQQQLPQQQQAMPQQQTIPQQTMSQQPQQTISQAQSLPQQQVVSQQPIPQQQQQQVMAQQQQAIPQQQGIPQQQAMPQQQYQPMMQQQMPQQTMQGQMPVQQVQMQPNVQQMTMQPQSQPSMQQQPMMQQPMQQMQQQQPTQMHQVPYSQAIQQPQPSIITQTSQQQVPGMMQQMHPQQMQGFQQGQMMPNIQPIMNIQSQPHLQPQYYQSSQPMNTGIVTSQTGLMTQGTMPQVSMPGTTPNLTPLQTYASVASIPPMQVQNMPQTPPIPSVQYSMTHMSQTNQPMNMAAMSMPQTIIPQQQQTQLPPQQQPGQSYANISSLAQSYTHGVSSSSVPSAIMMEHPVMNGEHPENPTAAFIESLNEVTAIADDIQQGEDAESTTGANAVAIDNKIEQAMDLVKSHLMFAVREEVEVLKEKISELMERIVQLEAENATLRAGASPETLAQLPQPLPQNTTTNNP